MSDENGVPPALVAFDVVIDQLRDQLGGMAARLKHGAPDVAFEVLEMEVELQVAVQRAGEGGVKFGFQVIEVGSKYTRSDVITQKVKLKLKPFDPKSKGKLDVSTNTTEPA
jgi:acetate kinase